jgi:glycosyltransferase involved in cell wall biosynthesis
MVSFKRQYPDWLFPGSSDRDPSLSHEDVAEARYWLDSINPLTWFGTWRDTHKYEPEVIIMQWWTSWWAPAWLVIGLLNRLFQHAPLLFLCHNVLPHEARWWDPLVARSVLRWGDRFVVQSDEEKQSLLALLPAAEATVFPLPVLDLFAAQRLPKHEARARLGLPANAPVLLFFGIVREYKGLKDLLVALASIRERLKGVCLLVAGEFWEDEAPYHALIEELGISQSVRIDNRYIPNEEASVYFSAADVLVAPYRHVTGSAVVQMARGFGLPVVTTTVGSLAEMTGNRPSLLAPPGDPDQLTTVISHFFEGSLESGAPEGLQREQGHPSWQPLMATIDALAREC